MTKTKIIKVNGMFCSHCEVTITKALTAIGVSSASASFAKGIVELSYDPDEVTIEDINKAITDAGYELGADSSYSQIISILVILLSFYVIANHLGWTRIFYLFPSIGTSVELGMLFAIGLMTSIHCIAMCGGINLTQQTANAYGKRQMLSSNLLYNLGRVASYTIVGAICGGIGQTIGLSGQMRGIIPIIVGLVMIVMALRMLGIFRGLPTLHLPLIRRFAPRLMRFQKRPTSLVIGLANGFMPCGPLQSMQLYALGTGSIALGALSMFLFSLGTVPLMFGFGLFAGSLQQRFRKYMLSISAIIIFVMGIHMFSDGLSLSGVSLPTYQAEESHVAVIADGVQQVMTEIDYGSYPFITVQNKIPVKWNIYVPDGKLNGCNRQILIPEYGLDIELNVGDNIVEFTPDRTGNVSFSCWMGMIKSTIYVQD